jgi:hypothetical protein
VSVACSRPSTIVEVGIEHLWGLQVVPRGFIRGG